MNHTLFIISAPSGGGKTTIVENLLKLFVQRQVPVDRVITYTTKQPRVGEIPGIDYHFISQEDFFQRINNNFFMEWSNAYQAYYGSPRSILDDIQENKRSYLLVIDRVGLQKIIDQAIVHTSFWIEPPSIEILARRLRERGTETEEQMHYRLHRARQEMESEQSAPLCTHIIVNKKVDVAAKKIERIMLKKLLAE